MQWDFPGSPVVRTLRFHCRAHRNHPWRGKSYPTCYAAWPKKKKSNALSRCDERQLYSTPKPCPNRIFRRTWTPLPAFHQSNPLAGPLSRLKHHTCTFWKASQLSRTLTVITTLASGEMPMLLFIWLTATLGSGQSQGQSKHCLTDRQPPKAWGTHTHTNSLSRFPHWEKHLIPNSCPTTQPWLTLQTALRCPESSTAQGQFIRNPSNDG